MIPMNEECCKYLSKYRNNMENIKNIIKALSDALAGKINSFIIVMPMIMRVLCMRI